MSKAQVANEFLILVGVGLIFMMMILYGVSNNMKFLVAKKEQNAIRDVGFAVQNEFFFASNVKDGYYREFLVPERHNGVEYTITINSGYLMLSSQSGENQEFAIPEVIGNIHKGTNNISRIRGVIYLN